MPLLLARLQWPRAQGLPWLCWCFLPDDALPDGRWITSGSWALFSAWFMALEMDGSGHPPGVGHRIDSSRLPPTRGARCRGARLGSRTSLLEGSAILTDKVVDRHSSPFHRCTLRTAQYALTIIFASIVFFCTLVLTLYSGRYKVTCHTCSGERALL
jgi:hypothetical protein